MIPDCDPDETPTAVFYTPQVSALDPMPALEDDHAAAIADAGDDFEIIDLSWLLADDDHVAPGRLERELAEDFNPFRAGSEA